ncbi:DUF2567 domain-containing protein [soil metagenome]
MSGEQSAAPAETVALPDLPTPPRTSRGRATATVVAALATTGVLIGGLWAWVAPPIHGVYALTRAGDRVQTYLGNESDNFFVSAFLMFGLLWVVSVIAPVWVWQWRAHRGPGMVAALAVGAVLCGVVATTVGAVVVKMRYPAVTIDSAPVTPDDRVYYYVEAPAVFFGQAPLHMATTLLVPAATVALVYAMFTVSTVRDDLGAYPPVEVRAWSPTPLPAPVVTTPETAEQSTTEWQRPQESPDASAVEPGQR